MTPRFLCQSLRAVFTLLGRNRLSTALGTLGVTVSVASIVALVSIGQGAQRAVEQQVATMGDNVAVVMPGAHRVGTVRQLQGSEITLTIGDAIALQQDISLVHEVCWGRRDPTQVIHGNRNWRLPVVGINPGCFSVRGWAVTSGEIFTEADMEQSATVAVLGHTAAERLFEEGQEPVGATLIIKRVPFRVIGVLSPKGQAPAGSDQDDIIFIPFSTAQRKVHGAKFYEWVEAISVSTFRREDLSTLAEHMRQTLRERHRLPDGHPDDFAIRTQLDLAEVYEGASRTLVRFLIAVALIASLVGGIGIMNMLLVSVTERTREIGVRMAVGAKRRHILAQFLIEAMTLSLVGGCVGILLGVLGARLTTVVAGWPTIISSHTIAAAFVFSVAVGLFFGLYPANKASRLNPIDALRYE
jgi:putative ABC transport system permease protein